MTPVSVMSAPTPTSASASAAGGAGLGGQDAGQWGDPASGGLCMDKDENDDEDGHEGADSGSCLSSVGSADHLSDGAASDSSSASRGPPRATPMSKSRGAALAGGPK